MYQRVPSTAEYFASIWIGTVLTDWKGDGQFRSISHAAPLTKQNSTWWFEKEKLFRFELNYSIECRWFSLDSSRIGKQPSYLSLKETSERQACVALAIFDDQSGCMHNWFCSWETYALCEIREWTSCSTSRRIRFYSLTDPPEPVTSGRIFYSLFLFIQRTVSCQMKSSSSSRGWENRIRIKIYANKTNHFQAPVSSSTGSNTIYVIILVIVLLVGIGICVCYCFCRQKKKSTHNARSLDSIGSEFSQYEL